MKNFIKNNVLFIFFSIIYLFIGILNVKDYGVGIEEHFQRSSGFFWLNFILDHLSLDSLKMVAENKFLELKEFSPDLPRLSIANYYGILFDLPAALIESLLNIKNPNTFFYLRHLMNFLFFYIGGVFFYKILSIRFSKQIIPFLGTCMYLLTPKIYGNSFFDGKDVFFLSILTISFYFYLNYEKNKNLGSLIMMILLFSFSTSSRIFGLMLPVSFIFLVLLETLNSKNPNKNFILILIFSTLYLIFLFLHWPYMWTFDYTQVLNFFDPFKVHTDLKVFFEGSFYESSHLPLKYIPKWIIISTPIFYLIFFSIGIFFYLKRIFLRIINIEAKSLGNDLWKGKKEKFDFFIFFSFFQIFVIYVSTNPNLIKGWTHFLFLNYFIVYFASLGIFYLLNFFRKKKFFIQLFFLIIIFFFSELLYKIVIYHPYQSIYLNNFMTKKNKNLYQVDYQSLSRSEAILEILKDTKKERTIVGTASWTPLKNGMSMVPINIKKQILFSGTSNKEKADYIYTNFFYEVDTRYNKKYSIPENFNIFKTLYIDDIKVYSIYKKN